MRTIPTFADNGGALCADLVGRGWADAGWWFPATKGQAYKAKDICRRCELLAPCRTWARTQREWGVWGGESEWDRRQLGISPAPSDIEDFLR